MQNGLQGDGTLAQEEGVLIKVLCGGMQSKPKQARIADFS